jgi:putative transposase
MPDYRRARVPGATYFFTVNLHDRSSDLLIREIELLRSTVRATKARHPFISMPGW